jgi:hypothetical protein
MTVPSKVPCNGRQHGRPTDGAELEGDAALIARRLATAA